MKDETGNAVALFDAGWAAASKTYAFMMPLEVVADSRDEALEFARQFEQPKVRMSLQLESTKRLELRPKELKGVYWVGGRCFYPIRRRTRA